MGRRQGIFWMCTIPYNSENPNPNWSCSLLPELSWIKGQQEIGHSSSYHHWQICCAFSKKKSLAQVKELFGEQAHCELSRSNAAGDYCWKEDTAVDGTRFEHGAKPIRRNDPVDWEEVWTNAQKGNLSAIPANIRVVSYRTIRTIGSDYDRPRSVLRSCYVFWGTTGTGKSRRAWEEAGLEAYSKDPRTKFWCGYQGESNVVLDEFRGGIDVSHLLRWLDRYPVRVEIKGSSRPLIAEKIWITSNLNPKDWYPDIDYQTQDALLRRLTITEFPQ